MTITVLNGKQIVLGVTGGIAAYKAATVCSRLVQAGAHVDVVLTAAAQKFITPLTFQALTHRPVFIDMFNIPAGENIPHITLADNADLLLVAPATANTLGKLAHGLADNLLTAVALATPAPILLAPAMETDMWQHPATQANMQLLRQRGAAVTGPAAGRLASGAVGSGRLVEPEAIVDAARHVLARQGNLAGLNVVVTAGGTREAIDPVRFVTNHSSGKMGFAVAQIARDRGARVTLISTARFADLRGVEAVPVNSAAEMHQAVMQAAPSADVLVMSAAVADYRPARVAAQKIKKSGDSARMSLELERTIDILAAVAQQKSAGNGPRITVGFAAETENLLRNARGKLERKNLDLIVANDVTAADAGFGTDTNRVTLLGRDGSVETLPLLHKTAVAEAIFDRVTALIAAQAG